MLKEIAPSLTNVAVMWNPRNVSVNGFYPAAQEAAAALSIAATAAHVENAEDIRKAIDALASQPNSGLIFPPDFTTVVHRDLILSLTAQHRLPATFPFRLFAMDGGLISYGVNLPVVYAQAASYVDRILRGEKPADLPVQAPTKFDIVINLKTARALGLTIPPMLLGGADDLID